MGKSAGTLPGGEHKFTDAHFRATSYVLSDGLSKRCVQCNFSLDIYEPWFPDREIAPDNFMLHMQHDLVRSLGGSSWQRTKGNAESASRLGAGNSSAATVKTKSRA
ncbi:MAG: hypothetical protein DME26_00835 [Verrucomicrobia bacterium]|nr:MAG: hypothetical protein DME26_00835 [Verrucomicrobiota bacterium]